MAQTVTAAESARLLDRYPFTRLLLKLVGAVAAGGIVLVAVYGWQERSAGIAAVGALVALAAGAVGALAGFLFGLPRFSPARVAEGPAEADAPARALAGASVLTPGTNLEQVSDWLTKLLLGAGLTQLDRLGGWFGSLVDALAHALTGGGGDRAAPDARVLAGSLVICYLVVGFLFGYVMTALWYYRRLKDLLEPAAPASSADLGAPPAAEPARPVVPAQIIP